LPPGPWERARDPALVDRWDLHVHVRELIDRERYSRTPAIGWARHPGLQSARVLLEDAGAERSPDVRLRFDLGEVYDLLQDPMRAIEVLEPALQMAPDAPGASSAYATLAQSYARLDDSRAERRVYEKYIPRITDENTLANTLLNLAEADMHLGDLSGSIDEYRQAIDVAARLPNIVALEHPIGTLARWGLAVALDRFGDISGGAAETRFALQLDSGMRLISHGASVFFSPERERLWYVALGYGEIAKQAPDAPRAAAAWHRAEGCWQEYVDDAKARGPGDRWLDIARDRLTKAKAQRAAAERRAHRALDYPDRRCID
jgi:tetratricopeptide (TPR) repeat protein